MPGFRKELPSCFLKITGILDLIEDVFKYFVMCIQKFLGESMNCTPRACINDGFTDLIV